MMRDRIGHKPDAALLCDLLHDLRLANTRRAKQQHRSLPDLRNHIDPYSSFKDMPRSHP